MVRVAAVIVSYNTREALRTCLAALESSHCAAIDLRVTVVDNASSDGSAALVAADHPRVRLVASGRNLGFAGGVNAGLDHNTECDYVLVLNPDVEVAPDTIERLVEFLERTPSAAAAAPLLSGPDGAVHTHLYRRFPTRTQIVLFWTVLAPLSRRLPWVRRRWFEHDLRGQGPIAVEQIPGAALLIRGAALREVGRMDPDYFIWFEDVDWCYRARRVQQDLFVLPEAHARHEGGASFQSWSTATRVFQFQRAFFRFLCKHRLDELRGFAYRVLSFDLALKQLILAAMRPLRPAEPQGALSLAAARRAIRAVVEQCAAGELARFTSADLSPALPAPRVKERAVGWTADTAVDAVIVNWNGRRYLPTCIAALERSSVPIRILVVDNASSDDSVAYLRANYPHIAVLPLDRNAGYAGGANAGLRATAGQYAIVLNPDVALEPRHVELLKNRLDEVPAIGAAQGKLYQISPDDFTAGRRPSASLIDSAGHVIRRSRMVVDRGQGQPDSTALSREAAIFSACGAALFLRRAMLEQLAPAGEFFAESFFAYKEDIDLGWRARVLGWDIRYLPDAVAYHVRSAPLDSGAWLRMPLAVRRHSFKNHYLLMLRNDRMIDILSSLPFIAGWEVLRLGHALLRDPRVLAACVDAVRELGPSLHARRDLFSRSRDHAAIARWFGSEPITIETRGAARKAVTA